MLDLDPCVGVALHAMADAQHKFRDGRFRETMILLERQSGDDCIQGLAFRDLPPASGRIRTCDEAA